MSILAPLLLSAAAGFAGSDRAALNLAIAATRGGPPDLSSLIVLHRKEYLTGVRDAARRLPPCRKTGCSTRAARAAAVAR